MDTSRNNIYKHRKNRNKNIGRYEARTATKRTSEDDALTTITEKGTNNTETKDIQCNVYDMASNDREWTTESSNDSNGWCVRRGGGLIYSSDYTSNRGYYSASSSYDYVCFRPLLYL